MSLKYEEPLHAERSCTEAVMEYLELGCSISQGDVDWITSGAPCEMEHPR
jgi:hypothetical protein